MENESSSIKEVFKIVGLFAGVFMPFFNIPLIIRIVRRKTSRDISLAWGVGVWSCIVLMYPSTLLSHDVVLRSFGLSNVILFSIVLIVVWIYHKEPPL
jgi:uncharacterized protein with PQ loop repeat